jgi:Zn-dependent protease with chaperone function
MAEFDKIPYPPSPDPDEVPEDLTDFPPSYVNRERLLLVCLFLFLGIYLSLVVVSGFLSAWLALRFFQAPGKGTFLLALLSIPCLILFVYLVKGFFKRPRWEKEMELEVAEEDHPNLFVFIRRVCEETGADEPRGVFVMPDVNAAVRTKTSFVNLFVPPKRDLVVGLGLINCLNLSEFKAVLAHEFGHFTQGGFIDAYTSAVYRIIFDMVAGRDWFDDLVDWAKNQGSVFTAIGMAIGGVLWLFRTVLTGVFRLLAFQRTSVLREGEFHADLVAASVAGSDAIVHGLLKTKFGSETFGFALGELRKAADHKLYTADLYFHQHAAADIIRKQKKDLQLGLPPRLEDRFAGKKVQVFDPETEEDPGDEGDYHPSKYDREENVKERFVPAETDDRSPWLLFDDPGDLREKLTHKMYRTVLKVPKGTDLTDPRTVQKFIDDEHLETTFDPKYEGVYDDRLIAPGDLDELNDLIRKEPWTDDRLTAVFNKLYHDVKGRAEDRADLQKDYDKTLRQSRGGSSRKAKRLLKDLEQKLDKADEWFDSLDRRAYLVFVQMAYRVHNDFYFDLVNRYRFHMAVQGIFKSAKYHEGRAFFHWNMVTGSDQIHPDDVVELMHVLREARSALKKILREARELDMPAMKNFEEGDRLADFLLDQDLISELPETYVKGKWLDKLLRQLDQVRRKAARLHWKSLGGILRLQEEIAGKFLAKTQPVAAEVIDVRPQ